MNDHSSCFIRASQPWAGPGFGFVFLPRIGMEVTVAFVQGDPDQPLITGTVYNGENVMPYPQPDEMTKSTIRTQSSQGGGGYNELSFEDKKGAEEVYLRAQMNLREQVLHDHTATVGNDRSIEIDNDDSTTVGNDQELTVNGHRKIQIDNGSEQMIAAGEVRTIKGGIHETIEDGGEVRNIIGDVTEIIDGNESREVSGNTNKSVGGNETREIAGSLSETVSGSAEQKVTGEAIEEGLSIYKRATTQIQLEAGVMIDMAAGAEISITTPKWTKNVPDCIEMELKKESMTGFSQSVTGFSQDLTGVAISNHGVDLSLHRVTKNEAYFDFSKKDATISVGITYLSTQTIHIYM